MVAITILGLTGCSNESPPRVVSETIYGPPHLGDWIEVDGRWAVTANDGAAGALLQLALDDAPDIEAGEPRDAAPARWVDLTTGESVWERDDLGSVLYVGDEQLVAAVGAGSNSAFAALDLGTGETIWSVPASDIGECAGWRLVDYWYDEAAESETGDGDSDDSEPGDSEEPPRLVLRAPTNACRGGERALLVTLDTATGEHAEVLRGQGTVTAGHADDHLALVSWRSDAAIVHFYDETGAASGPVELDAAELLADTRVETLSGNVDLLLQQLYSGRPWLRVTWNEDGSRWILNDVLLDPEQGTAGLEQNADCVPDEDQEVGVSYRYQASTYRYDSTTLDWCVVTPTDSGEASVRTDHGERTSWTVAHPDGALPWTITSCRGEVGDLTDERTLLLGAAPDAQLRAYDVLDGEVLWSFGEGDDAGPAEVDAWRDPDRAFVISEDADGRQLVSTLRLCTGEVLEEREVAGAVIDNRSISSSGWVVAVPAGETTLIASFTGRGTKPELPDGDETDEA